MWPGKMHKSKQIVYIINPPTSQKVVCSVTKTSHSWLKREKFHMWKVVDDQSSSYWLTIKMFLRRKSPVFPLTVNIVKSGADCLFTIKKCLLRFSDKLNSVVHSSEVVYLGEDEAFESCWRIFSAINYRWRFQIEN